MHIILKATTKPVRMAMKLAQRVIRPWTLLERNKRVIWHSTGSKQVWGYVDKHSVVSGETFNLMLSTGPSRSEITGRVEIFRIGHYSSSDRRLVCQSSTLNLAHRGVSNTAAVIGPNWPHSVTGIPTGGWKSGYYAIDFVSDRGKRERDVAFVVVTNPSLSGDILVKLCTNTYQAYNRWGGHSFYRGDFIGGKGDIVSFDRPTPPDFYMFEYYFVIWLENLANEFGVTVDYATDFDVHKDPAFTENCGLFISVGHDEYWSKEEFDNVYARIFELGKDTMFLGANTAYVQVRYADINGNTDSEPRGRELICYKTVEDPIRFQSNGDPRLFLTCQFRDESRRPETMLTGDDLPGSSESTCADPGELVGVGAIYLGLRNTKLNLD